MTAAARRPFPKLSVANAARVTWLALVTLGTLFLVKQKVQGRKQWPMLSFNDLVTALAELLPRRQMTAEELAYCIEKRHRLRRHAKESHARRRKRAAALESGQSRIKSTNRLGYRGGCASMASPMQVMIMFVTLVAASLASWMPPNRS